MLSACKTYNLFSNILVAKEYSTRSTSASPFSTLSFINVNIDLVFSNSSMKDISLTYLRLVSCSIAVQKRIGAALLKLSQKSESSHSGKRFFKTLMSGTAE